MPEAELFQQRGAPPTTLRFDSLSLRFRPGNSWHDAQWEFSADGSTLKFPASQVEEIATKSSSFDVTVVDGNDALIGQFTIQAVMCGYPSHSFCFLLCADQDGMWSGYTLSRSFGKVVVVPHRFDPS